MTGLTVSEEGGGWYSVEPSDAQLPEGSDFAVFGTSSTADVIIIGSWGVRPETFDDRLEKIEKAQYGIISAESIGATSILVDEAPQFPIPGDFLVFQRPGTQMSRTTAVCTGAETEGDDVRIHFLPALDVALETIEPDQVIIMAPRAVPRTHAANMRGTDDALTTLGSTAPVGWVNNAALADDTIGADKIAENAITAAKIANTALDDKGNWNIGKTDYALSTSGIQAIWDALTSALTTAGSIGKLLIDMLDVAVGTRSSHTAEDAKADVSELASQASVDALHDFDPSTQEVTTNSASREASKATGFAVAGDAMTLTSTERTVLAERILGGDWTDLAAPSADSAQVALYALRYGFSATADGIVIYGPDGATAFTLGAVTTDAEADPITEVKVNGE